MRSPLARYTLARAGLFVAALVPLWLLGARGLVLVLLAALASSIASLPLLSRQRDAVSAALAQRRQGRRSRLDEGARAEDE